MCFRSNPGLHLVALLRSMIVLETGARYFNQSDAKVHGFRQFAYFRFEFSLAPEDIFVCVD